MRLPLVHPRFAGLRGQRERVGSTSAYRDWYTAARASHPGARAAEPSGVEPGSSAAPDALLSPQRPAASSSGSSGGSGRTAAFLAAVDAAVLSLKLDALESHRLFPFHFGAFQIGAHKVGWPAPPGKLLGMLHVTGPAVLRSTRGA